MTLAWHGMHKAAEPFPAWALNIAMLDQLDAHVRMTRRGRFGLSHRRAIAEGNLPARVVTVRTDSEGREASPSSVWRASFHAA